MAYIICLRNLFLYFITMATIDAQVVQEFQKYTNGAVPEFFLFVVSMPSLLLQILLAGGLLAAFIQKPYMLGVSKQTLYFIPLSPWSTSKFKDVGAFSMSKTEIQNTKYRKLGPAHYFTLTLTSGKKMRLVANTLYKKLEGQATGIDQLQKFLIGA